MNKRLLILSVVILGSSFAHADRQFKATLQPVLNRGKPSPAFLNEMIDWAKTAPDALFAPNSGHDVYELFEPQLGPYGGPLHRKAAMLEILRVLGGYESSWNWNEGVDTSKDKSLFHSYSEETGAFQVSADSMNDRPTLKAAFAKVSPNDLSDAAFIKVMKTNHKFALEYAVRLFRITTAENGPFSAKEFKTFLRRDAVAEFEIFLKP